MIRMTSIILVLCLVMALVGGAQTPTNLILDYDLIYIDPSLRAGDAGILRFVIENSGGQKAEKVIVWIPDVGDIYASKRFYLGTLLSDETATISTRLDVAEDASTGLHILPVHVMYTGYDSNGKKEEYQERIYEIPFIIYGDPLFQITPSKTTYFKDNLDELNLEGLTMDPVKDLEATLSSSCITIIGSSRKYVGNIDSNQTFKIVYPIKPSSSGACVVSLRLSYTDESGSKVSDNVSIGLNVEEAGVDFKVVNITYNPTGPGETVAIKIALKNVGQTDSEDTTLTLSLTDPFAPVDTSEKYIGEVPGGQEIDVEFNLAVGWDAETKTYPIPLIISYKVGGTSQSIEKNIGVDVSGKIILEVINVDASRGTIRVEVANIGTRTADGVKATLVFGSGISETQQQQIPSGGRSERFSGNRTGSGNFSRTDMTQSLVSYKSDIKPNKQTTFTFQGEGSGQALLTLEYTGLNNERVKQTERITLPKSADFTGLAGSMSAKGRWGTDITQLALYALIILIVGFVAYKLYKRRKQ